MTRVTFCVLAACGLPLAIRSQDKVNQDSQRLEDFSKRVAAYVAIHKAARSEVHSLKPTSSPQAIARYEHRLAHEIRERRKGAAQGAIFTPDISLEFRRLIRIAMQGAGTARVHESLNHAEPVHLPTLHVDAAYPENIPLQSTPPSVLLNLPTLPPEVEYRVVDHELLLRDVEANLVVDILHNALP